MAITYYMLQIPTITLFILMVLFGAVFAGLATYLFRKFTRLKILRSHNEVTGFFLISIASFYALLLSFVVLVVWDNLNEIHNHVSKEGSAAMGLYREIKYYPDTLESQQIMKVYLKYIYYVIDDEFPKMELMQQSRITSEALNELFFEIESLNPKTPSHIQFASRMVNQLNELNTYRALRMSSIDSEVPAPMWLPMMLGALITIICAMLLDIEHTRLHIILSSMLGAFIGIFLFTIIFLDHPYTGNQKIKPKLYEKIFTLEQWSKENKISNKQIQ